MLTSLMERLCGFNCKTVMFNSVEQRIMKIKCPDITLLTNQTFIPVNFNKFEDFVTYET